MLIINFIATIVILIIAKTKGFNVWAWILAGGLLGLIIILFLPSAKVSNIDEELKQRRKNTGTNVGLVLSVLFVIITIIIIALIDSSYASI
ncbi:MAG: hypothetical protein ACOC22_04200 [bacterium]